ncbi:FAD-dependent monooxygenase [Actinomycetospora rhizophila]|uniref:FAD-dependent monooxygenase n=1 Tax=Actinomycetospora rhizophila TaxID=1416876 RepID=A0ABV9ZR19_9PSEU
MSTDADVADVLVLGAGPAGASCAIALARDGCSVTVVRGRVPRRPRLGETVPPAMVRPLAALGVWEEFRAAEHLPDPGTVLHWGDDAPSGNDHILDPYGCGWHLDRDRFDTMLLDAARAAGARVHDRVPGGGPELRAPFVVDATGRAACVARRHGPARVREDLLIGLVRFGTSSGADTRTVVEASLRGWWYAAPLPRGRAVTMFFTDADLLPRGSDARRRFWDHAWAQTAAVREVAALEAHGSIHTAVAHTGAIPTCAGSGWIAVGDAARTLDPLSGQGLTTACVSGIRAAAAIRSGAGRGALAAYCERVANEHRAALSSRRTTYRREQRWPRDPFWARRHR